MSSGRRGAVARARRGGLDVRAVRHRVRRGDRRVRRVIEAARERVTRRRDGVRVGLVEASARGHAGGQVRERRGDAGDRGGRRAAARAHRH